MLYKAVVWLVVSCGFLQSSSVGTRIPCNFSNVSLPSCLSFLGLDLVSYMRFGWVIKQGLGHEACRRLREVKNNISTENGGKSWMRKKLTRIEYQPPSGISIKSQTTLSKECGSLALNGQGLCFGYARGHHLCSDLWEWHPLDSCSGKLVWL